MKRSLILLVFLFSLLVVACSNHAGKGNAGKGADYTEKIRESGKFSIRELESDGLTLNELELIGEYGRTPAERRFAQGVLASVYKNGEKGVPQNYEKAAKWYRLGAEQGNVMDQFELGLMYRKGQGVTKDYVLAYMWLNLSADSGFLRHAVNARDYLAKEMTAQQIEKAEKLSKACKAKNYKNC